MRDVMQRHTVSNRPREMGVGGGELVTTNEPTVFTESLLDSTVVEDRQGNRSLSNPASTGTDESDRSEGFCKADNFPDQFVTPETGPWWWGW